MNTQQERQSGSLTIHHGNMYGGKSTALIRQFKKLKFTADAEVALSMENQSEYTVKNAEAFVHVRDNRYSENATSIVTHDGESIPAIPVTSCLELSQYVKDHNIDIIAIDEIQFFLDKNKQGDWMIIHTLLDFLEQGKTIIVAGLTYDFRRMPFGPIGDIILISTNQHKHLSECSICKGPALYPQRLIDGKPAYKDEPLIKVGGSNDYQPRCAYHHKLPVRPIIKENISAVNSVS